jgi:hypothetical protein
VAKRKTSTIPTTLRTLRAWLRDADEGKALFADLAEDFLERKCRTCQNIRPYPRVLMVLRRIGDKPGVEAYAEEGVNLRFMELPDIPDTDAEFARLTEELIELKLPKNWRPLVQLPERRIHREVFRGVSIGAAYDNLIEAGQVEALRKERP